MRRPFSHGVGGVLSADIAVPEHDRELGFYSRVLTTGEAPLWNDDLTNNKGTPIIGLGARSPVYGALPLQWLPHFQVADVAASAAHALELGGKELMHARSNAGQSQWAVFLDHVGAAFGVIPVVQGESNVVDESARIGCISWLTLAVSDASATRDFYRRVVGWSAKPMLAEGGDEYCIGYEMKTDNDLSAAEIRTARGKHEGLPPVWLISLPVGDFEESLRRVRECGGEIVTKMTAPKYAVIRDPVGVCIALQEWQEGAAA